MKKLLAVMVASWISMAAGATFVQDAMKQKDAMKKDMMKDGMKQ